MEIKALGMRWGYGGRERDKSGGLMTSLSRLSLMLLIDPPKTCERQKGKIEDTECFGARFA